MRVTLPVLACTLAACAAQPPAAPVPSAPTAHLPPAVTASAPPPSASSAVLVTAAPPPPAPPPPIEAAADAGVPALPAGSGTRHAPKLTGQCVNVRADLKQRLEGRLPNDPPARVDLDKDGQADLIYTTDADTTYHGYVYLMRGNCGYWAGEWEGSVPTPIKTWANGASDLEAGTPCRPSCCPELAVSLYRFDGSVYRKISERIETRDCSLGGF